MFLSSTQNAIKSFNSSKYKGIFLHCQGLISNIPEMDKTQMPPFEEENKFHQYFLI